jgi:hypothetical protein
MEYYDPILQLCIDKLNENYKCYETYQCLSPMNCTNNGICQCGGNEYHNVSTLSCIAQKTYTESCAVDFNCRVDKYLECRDGSCQCISLFPFWSKRLDKCILPSTYSESCFDTTDCDTSKSLVCNDGSSNCKCPQNVLINACDCPRNIGNEYYWNGTNCVIAREYSQTCYNASTNYMCKTLTEGTICSGLSLFTCKCSTLQYYRISSKKCENKLSINGSCAQADACRSDLGLSCQTSSCNCDTKTQFWNGTRCITYYTYNSGACSNDNACEGNLICRSSGTSCNCPTSVNIGNCDCPRIIGNEYYWNGTNCVIARDYSQTCFNSSTNYMCKTLTESTLCIGSSTFTCKCSPLFYYRTSSKKCESQLSIDGLCTQIDACRSDLGLSCQAGTCKCDSTTQFWNGTRCIDYYTYNTGTCSSDNDCKGNLICRSSGTSCNCPTTVSNTKCDCPTRIAGGEYYWDGLTCALALDYSQTCYNASTNYMCKTLTESTICSGLSTFTCRCSTLFYYRTSTKKCESQLSIDGLCPQIDACRSDLGLSCQAGTCKCDSTTQFWNGTRCIAYYTYNTGTCSNDNQCKGNLICRTNGNSCNCPTTVTAGRCDCQTRAVGNEYYWNGIDCVIAGVYNQPCNIANYTCQTLTQLTQCNGGKCTCGPYGVWSSTKCIFCATNWYFQRGSCFRGVSNPTRIDRQTIASIPGVCNVATARLAVITSADLSWIPNVPTTSNEMFYTLSPNCLSIKNNALNSHGCNDHTHSIFCEYILV